MATLLSEGLRIVGSPCGLYTQSPLPGEQIVSAAIQDPAEPTVYLGGHHDEAKQLAMEYHPDQTFDIERWPHGFLTNRNRFVSRDEAFRLARLSRQFTPRQAALTALDSQDLYADSTS